MAGSIPASPSADGLASARHVSPSAEAWRRFKRHRMAMASLMVLLLMVLAVYLGPFF